MHIGVEWHCLKGKGAFKVSTLYNVVRRCTPFCLLLNFLQRGDLEVPDISFECMLGEKGGV